MKFRSLIPELLILIVIKARWTNSEGLYGTCNSSFSCGSISNFQYPFLSLQDPPQCGYPGFELNCDQQKLPTINIMNITFLVLGINTTTQTLKLIREDMVHSTCPQHLVNTTIDHQLFNYTLSYTNISFLFGCNVGLAIGGPIGSILCDETSIANLVPGAVGPGTCKTSVVIPFPIGPPNPNRLVQILQEGFEIMWKVDPGPCADCTRSGGQCVYNISKLGTACVCLKSPLTRVTCLLALKTF